MTEQSLVPGPMTAEPGPRVGRWRAAVVLLVLLAGLAVTTFLVIALVQSAGAAGGCGGG